MKIAMEPDLIDSLQRVGLNRYESKAYLALLNSGPLTASELSKKSDIPRPRTYDILKSLEKKGVCSVQPGRPTKYKSKPADEAMENLKSLKKNQHEEELSEIDKVKEELSRKASEAELPEDMNSEDFLWFLKDRDKIDSKIKALLGKAKNEVVIATDPEDALDHLDRYEEHLQEAKGRGVNVKLITHDRNEVEKAVEFAEIQENPHKHRFMAIDDHSVLFLTPPGGEEVGAWVKSPFFTKGLKHNL